MTVPTGMIILRKQAMNFRIPIAAAIVGFSAAIVPGSVSAEVIVFSNFGPGDSFDQSQFRGINEPTSSFQQAAASPFSPSSTAILSRLESHWPPAVAGDLASTLDGGLNWTVSSGQDQGAFRVSGVPDPAQTALAICIGLAVIGLRMLRKR